MRTVLLALFSTLLSVEALACERVEYAQLKDSNRKELTTMVCEARRSDKLYEDLIAINKAAFDKQIASGFDTSGTSRRMKEQWEKRVACTRVADAAASMLLKKYKAQPPKNCD